MAVGVRLCVCLLSLLLVTQARKCPENYTSSSQQLHTVGRGRLERVLRVGSLRLCLDGG